MPELIRNQTDAIARNRVEVRVAVGLGILVTAIVLVFAYDRSSGGQEPPTDGAIGRSGGDEDVIPRRAESVLQSRRSATPADGSGAPDRIEGANDREAQRIRRVRNHVEQVLERISRDLGPFAAQRAANGGSEFHGSLTLQNVLNDGALNPNRLDAETAEQRGVREVLGEWNWRVHQQQVGVESESFAEALRRVERGDCVDQLSSLDLNEHRRSAEASDSIYFVLPGGFDEEGRSRSVLVTIERGTAPELMAGRDRLRELIRMRRARLIEVLR